MTMASDSSPRSGSIKQTLKNNAKCNLCCFCTLSSRGSFLRSTAFAAAAAVVSNPRCTANVIAVIVFSSLLVVIVATAVVAFAIVVVSIPERFKKTQSLLNRRCSRSHFPSNAIRGRVDIDSSLQILELSSRGLPILCFFRLIPHSHHIPIVLFRFDFLSLSYPPLLLSRMLRLFFLPHLDYFLCVHSTVAPPHRYPLPVLLRHLLSSPSLVFTARGTVQTPKMARGWEDDDKVGSIRVGGSEPSLDDLIPLQIYISLAAPCVIPPTIPAFD